MSTLSKIENNLLALLFPAQCLGCGALLENRQEWICQECYASMATTLFHTIDENPLAVRLRSFFPNVVVNAAAQFYFINNGRWREVIHHIKYRGSWRSAYKMGYWYGCELLESPLYQELDIVVPVPLHRTRLLSRRYNQSEKIAEGIAAAMGLEVERRALRRTRNNPSQVTRSRDERWGNVENLFEVVRSAPLEGKHILLVDDVFTTGSTILALIEAIAAAAPGVRVSVATIGVSQREIMGWAI